MPYITLQTYADNKEQTREFSVSLDNLEKYIEDLYLDVQGFMICTDIDRNYYLYTWALNESALISEEAIDGHKYEPYITFDTFTNTFFDDGTENPNWDDELRLFTIPYGYFIQWLIDNETDFDEFVYEYTWDDTCELFYCADADDKVVKEEVIERPF